MTHLLRLECNGNYITLNSGNYSVVNYNPVAPSLSVTDAVSEIEDGGERLLTTRRNVTEACDILIRTPSAHPGDMSYAQTDQHYIEQYFMLAEEHQKSAYGYPVFVEFQPDGTTNVYRSEILSGKIELDAAALSRWTTGKVLRATLVWTRRFYWEGPETSIYMTAQDSTTPEVTKTIYNHRDGGTGHGNYLRLDGTASPGVIPSPLRIDYGNSLNSVARSYQFLVGQSQLADVFGSTFEGESASYGGTGNTSGATYSGGYFRAFTIPTTDALVAAWTLATADLALLRGRSYRFFARMEATIPANIYLKLSVKFPSSDRDITVTEGTEVAIVGGASGPTLQDLGTLQLPPWLPSDTSFQPLDLCLNAYSLSGSTETLNLDCIMMLPVDRFRVLKPLGYGMKYQTVLVDDGINNKIYTDKWTAAGLTGHYVGYGPRPMIWPGQYNLLYILVTNDSGGSEIARTHQISAKYRPRRLTI